MRRGRNPRPARLRGLERDDRRGPREPEPRLLSIAGSTRRASSTPASMATSSSGSPNGSAPTTIGVWVGCPPRPASSPARLRPSWLAATRRDRGPTTRQPFSVVSMAQRHVLPPGPAVRAPARRADGSRGEVHRLEHRNRHRVYRDARGIHAAYEAQRPAGAPAGAQSAHCWSARSAATASGTAARSRRNGCSPTQHNRSIALAVVEASTTGQERAVA